MVSDNFNGLWSSNFSKKFSAQIGGILLREGRDVKIQKNAIVKIQKWWRNYLRENKEYGLQVITERGQSEEELLESNEKAPAFKSLHESEGIIFVEKITNDDTQEITAKASRSFSKPKSTTRSGNSSFNPPYSFGMDPNESIDDDYQISKREIISTSMRQEDSKEKSQTRRNLLREISDSFEIAEVESNKEQSNKKKFKSSLKKKNSNEDEEVSEESPMEEEMRKELGLERDEVIRVSSSRNLTTESKNFNSESSKSQERVSNFINSGISSFKGNDSIQSSSEKISLSKKSEKDSARRYARTSSNKKQGSQFGDPSDFEVFSGEHLDEVDTQRDTNQSVEENATKKGEDSPIKKEFTNEAKILQEIEPKEIDQFELLVRGNELNSPSEKKNNFKNSNTAQINFLKPKNPYADTEILQSETESKSDLESARNNLSKLNSNEKIKKQSPKVISGPKKLGDFVLKENEDQQKILDSKKKLF